MSKIFAQKHSCLESWELNDACSRMTLIFLMSSPDIPSISPSVQPTQRCTTVHITLWSAPSQLSTHTASSPIKAYVQFCQFLLTDFKKVTLISRRSHFYETHLHWLFINSGGRKQWSKKAIDHFYPDPTVAWLEPLVSCTQRKCSVALAFPHHHWAAQCHTRADQIAICFQPTKLIPLLFHNPLEKESLLTCFNMLQKLLCGHSLMRL